jgi:hypothetical protein
MWRPSNHYKLGPQHLEKVDAEAGGHFSSTTLTVVIDFAIS